MEIAINNTFIQSINRKKDKGRTCPCSIVKINGILTDCSSFPSFVVFLNNIASSLLKYI